MQKVQQFKFAELLGIFIFMGIASFVYISQLNPFWLYGSLSYQQLKVSAWNGMWMRMVYLFISSFGIFAIFALVKLFNSYFIQLGKNTLPVYLLHGFVVMSIARYWRLDFNIFVEILICIILSAATCWVLQQSCFDTLLRKMSLWLMKPVENLGLK